MCKLRYSLVLAIAVGVMCGFSYRLVYGDNGCYSIGSGGICGGPDVYCSCNYIGTYDQTDSTSVSNWESAASASCSSSSEVLGINMYYGDELLYWDGQLNTWTYFTEYGGGQELPNNTGNTYPSCTGSEPCTWDSWDNVSSDCDGEYQPINLNPLPYEPFAYCVPDTRVGFTYHAGNGWNWGTMNPCPCGMAWGDCEELGYDVPPN